MNNNVLSSRTPSSVFAALAVLVGYAPTLTATLGGRMLG